MLTSVFIFLSFWLSPCLQLEQHERARATGLHLHLEDVNDTQIKTVEFEQQFTNINNQIDYISRTLNLNDSNKFSYIIQRCKELTSGFTALHRSLLKFNLLISPDNLICPGLSTFNQSEISRYIAYTENKSLKLSLYYATCLDCTFIIPDIEKLLDLTQQYFRLINKTLDGDFCTKRLTEKATGIVNLNNSYFKNNLQASNWYYGYMTKSQYKIKMFKRSATYNLTNCPIETPFVKTLEQVCFNCPEGSLFNLGNQTCTTCQVDQIFNIKSGVCEECLGSKQTVNQSIICRPCILANSQIYNQTTGKCELCVQNRYIDRNDNLCKEISCPAGTPRFNADTQQCEDCPKSEIIDSKDPTSCIKTNYIGLCPSEMPQYVIQTHSCQPCPSGTVFKKSSHKCQPNSKPA